MTEADIPHRAEREETKDGLRIRATLENALLLSDEEVRAIMEKAAPSQFEVRMKRDAYGRLVVDDGD